jgi:hypothetical protein
MKFPKLLIITLLISNASLLCMDEDEWYMRFTELFKEDSDSDAEYIGDLFDDNDLGENPDPSSVKKLADMKTNALESLAHTLEALETKHPHPRGASHREFHAGTYLDGRNRSVILESDLHE